MTWWQRLGLILLFGAVIDHHAGHSSVWAWEVTMGVLALMLPAKKEPTP